jgi:hypothetical protein
MEQEMTKLVAFPVALAMFAAAAQAEPPAERKVYFGTTHGLSSWSNNC